MSGPGVGGQVEGFRFRRLEKPEEFRQVQEVHRSVWGEASPESVPATSLRSIQDNGGFVLGAFADIHLAGFTVASLGWDGTTLYLYDQVLAVRPEYQNHHLGFELMKALRSDVVQLGLGEVRLVYDPIQSRNAWLFVHRLGGRPDRYLPHYYGQLPDTINAGLETDRIRLRWPLTATRTEERLTGPGPTREEELGRWKTARAIVVTEPGESGLRLPTEVSEPEGETAHLEIPFDLDLVRQHEAGGLRRWRHATRDAFRLAADLGYVVDDFAVVTEQHERRSFYFLGRATTSTAPDVPEGPPRG